MGVQIPVGFAQASQQFLLNGADHPFTVVTGHDVPSGATAASIAGLVRGGWASEVWGASTRGNNWSLGPCRVEFRTSPTIVEVALNSTVTAGTIAANSPCPANCAVLVQKRTNLAGRRNRGRMYVPLFLLGETSVDALGNITAGDVTTIQGWFNDLLVQWTTDDVTPLIFHEDGGVPTQIQSFTVSSRIATQRRRMR